ncbi:MAG: hypothetical protein WAM28_05760 [Chlamydiales bacterium]
MACAIQYASGSKGINRGDDNLREKPVSGFRKVEQAEVTEVEFLQLRYPLEPKDPNVSRENSFYAAVGKTMNIANNKLRISVCQILGDNEGFCMKLRHKHWLLCSSQLAPRVEQLNSALRGLEKKCVEQAWKDYAEASMEDNVEPENLEILQTAAILRRTIIIYMTSRYRDREKPLLKACLSRHYNPNHEIGFNLIDAAGALILFNDEGYNRTIADSA